jgi:hypothetical protein
MMTWDDLGVVPPTGLEPVLPAPEAGALSTELRGRSTILAALIRPNKDGDGVATQTVRVRWRYCTASARCAAVMVSEPDKSAIVRATFRMR